MTIAVELFLLVFLIACACFEILILIEFVRVHRGDVPFVPSTSSVIRAVIAERVLPREGVILDLGCGDGKALCMLANAGYAGPFIGYERAPYPWLCARVRCARQAAVRVHRASFLDAPLEQARGVYLFLLSDVLQALAPVLAARLPPGTPVVSAEFAVPGWTPERVLTAKGVTAKEAKIFVYRIGG